MKRWFLLLAALMLVAAVCFASAEGDLRHEVTGDISQLDVAEAEGLSRGQVDERKTEATLGTDIYLLVDDASASYVTFLVTDEDNVPVKGALIYITYNGITELYGVTDENGECSMYLFRDTEYGYRVEKEGYETAQGHFTAEKETKQVHAVLRGKHLLTIIVEDDGVLQPGVKVLIDGRTLTTDENGQVKLSLTNGEYSGVVITPDGRGIPLTAVVEGDTVIIVDIGRGDGFLVYDKRYQPEDYVLTKYLFSGDDVPKGAEETEEAYALRVEGYLETNPGVVLVEAQPERRQLAQGDKDVLDAEGEPIYAQRSCMPMGALLRSWEKEGAQKLIFTNEDVGMALPLASLRTGDMAKLFALLDALRHGGVNALLREDVRKSWNGRAEAGLEGIDVSDLDVTDINWDALVSCSFDEEEEAQRKLPISLYEDTLFEFRITPILPEALTDTLLNGFAQERNMPRDVVMLASTGYYLEQLRQWQADGRLTDDEADILFMYMTDGALTEDEMTDLCQRAEEDMLSRGAVEYLARAAVNGSMYRVSCWVIREETKVDCTALIHGWRVIWPSDERYQAAREQLEAETVPPEELKPRALARMEQAYRAQTLETRSEAVRDDDVKAVSALPDENDPFCDVLMGKRFSGTVVDVRRESVTTGNGGTVRFSAQNDGFATTLKESCALEAEGSTSGLVWLKIQ